MVVSKVRAVIAVVGLVTSAVGTVQLMQDPEVSRFDKAKYLLQQSQSLKAHLAARFRDPNLVALDDSTSWRLLVSHAGRAPQGKTVRMFQEHPALRRLWNDPNVKADWTGPAYIGWSEQPYSNYLTSDGIVLMDGAGDKIYVARGANIPANGDLLAAAISKAVYEYYQEMGMEAIHDQADAYAKAEAERDGSGEQGGIIRWTWRNLVPKPWKWGRRPCPSPHPDPITPTPDVVAYTPTPVVDNVDEEEQEPQGDFNIAPLLAALLGGGLSGFLKMKGAMAE